MLLDAKGITYLSFYMAFLSCLITQAYKFGIIFLCIYIVIFTLFYAVNFLSFVLIGKGVSYVKKILYKANKEMEKDEK